MNRSYLKALSIALVVVGALNALCGVLFVGGAGIAAYHTWHSTDDFGRYGTIGLVFWGLWLLGWAAVQISGGWRLLRLRGRRHGLVALASGILCVSGAWIPAIVLAAIGLPWLCSETTRQAFERTDQ